MPDVTIEISRPSVTIANADVPVTLNTGGGDVAIDTGGGDVAINQTSVAVDLNFGGQQGPPGPQGPPGGTAETYPAGQIMSAGRVVVIDGGEAFYFQPSDATHAGRAFGITLNAALTGQNVDIQTSGVVTDAAFLFSADATLYCDADGQVVDAMPASGTVQQVGASVASNSMLISIQPAITR